MLDAGIGEPNLTGCRLEEAGDNVQHIVKFFRNPKAPASSAINSPAATLRCTLSSATVEPNTCPTWFSSNDCPRRGVTMQFLTLDIVLTTPRSYVPDGDGNRKRALVNSSKTFKQGLRCRFGCLDAVAQICVRGLEFGDQLQLVDLRRQSVLHNDLAVNDDRVDAASGFAVDELADRRVERHEEPMLDFR